MQKAKFKIGTKTYEFKEITLKDYYEIQDLLASPEEKVTDFKLVEILTQCPVDELKKLKYGDWLMIWEETQHQVNLLGQGTEAIVPIIEFRGVKYGLPNIDDITIGEFADLDVIFTGKNPEKKLAEIAAVLYRPILQQEGNTTILEEYSSEGFRTRKELFKELPVRAIKSANSFFLQSANSSLKNTMDYLTSQPGMKEMMSEKDLEMLQSLTQDGFGGESSIPWLEKTFLNFKGLQNSKSESLLTGLHGGLTKSTKKSFWQRVKEVKDKRKLKK